MIKYSVNLEEVLVGLQEGLKSWLSMLNISGVKVRHFHLSSESASAALNLENPSLILGYKFFSSNPYLSSGEERLSVRDSGGLFEHSFELENHRNRWVENVFDYEKKVTSSEILIESSLQVSEIEFYVFYLEEVETAMNFVQIRCLQKDNSGFSSLIEIRTALVPKTQTSIQAPKLRGFVANTQEVPLIFQEGESSIVVDIEYSPAMEGIAVILFRIVRDGEDTGYVLGSERVEGNYGVRVYNPPETILEGNFELVAPSQILVTLDSLKRTYFAYYREVSQ